MLIFAFHFFRLGTDKEFLCLGKYLQQLILKNLDSLHSAMNECDELAKI